MRRIGTETCGLDTVFSPAAHRFGLTHWGRVTHIRVGKLIIIGSDNGLSPGRRQAIIWSNAGILLIGPLGTNFSEILIAIEIFSVKKMHLNMSSGKLRPFCLGLNELNSEHVFSCYLWFMVRYLNIAASSNGSIFRVTGPSWGEFPSQRPVTQGFDVLFDLRLDKQLSKQSRHRWFETLSRSYWRHCNGDGGGGSLGWPALSDDGLSYIGCCPLLLSMEWSILQTP